MKLTKIILALLIFGISFTSVANALAADKLLLLGTSSAAGVYHPVGEALCKLINQNRDTHLHRCAAQTTGGSVYNIKAIVSGELNIAITKADLIYKAYNGLPPFQGDSRNQGLRFIATLYSEPIAIIIKNNVSEQDFSSLTGKTINIGNKGSGKRTISDEIFKTMNWGDANFKKIYEFSTSEAAKSFCTGDIDILVEAVGMPSEFYNLITQQCDGKFLPLPEKIINHFKNKGPYYTDFIIPPNLYKNNKFPVKTLSLDVVLATHSRVSTEAISLVSKVILNKNQELRRSHPALANSDVKFLKQNESKVPGHGSVQQPID